MAQFTPVGVTALVKGHGQFKADLASMGKSIKDTGGFASGVKGQFLGLGDSVLSLGKTAAMAAAGGIAALGAGLTAVVATSVGVAARVSEMTRVLHFLGQESGLTTDQVDEFVQAIVDEGIRLDVAQQVASTFIRRNMDMAQALDLVKVAQGAAIIANEDSSDTLAALTDAILTNNVLMLRRRGITVDSTVAFEEYMKTQGKGTQATVDNSEAIADQTQKLDFLRREVAMAEDNYNAQNAELIHARDYWKEGSNELQKFQTRVDKASLALDKKRASLADAERGLAELKAAHGTVSDAIKVTTDDLSGEERSAAFLNAVLKDGEKLIPLYGEAMKEPGKRARSLKRDLFNLRLAIGTPFLGAFGEGVDALRAFVKQITEAIAEGGALRPVIEGIAETATEVITKILALASQVATLALAGDVGGILGMLGLGPEATALIGKIMSDLAELAQTVVGAVGPALQFVADNAMPALSAAIAFVNEHWEAFKGALIAVGALLGGAAIAALVAGLGAAIAGLLTPINLIVAAVALLGAAWAENWFGIREAVAAVVEFLRPAIDSLKEGFAEFLVSLEPLGPILKDFLPVLGEIAQIIGAVLLVAVRGLIAGLGELLPYIGTAFVAAVQAATTVISAFVDFIKGAFAMIKGIITGDMDAAREGAYQVLLSLVQMVEGLLIGLIQIATAWGEGMWNAIVGIWESIRDALVGGSIVPDLINSIVALFTGLPDAILGALGGLVEKIGKVFRDLFGPVLEFDPSQVAGIFAALLEGLEVLTESWLLFMETLNETWIAFSEYLLEESWPTIRSEWIALNVLMVTRWLTTMDILLAALVAFVNAALVQLQRLLDKFLELVDAIRDMRDALDEAKKTLEDFVTDAVLKDLDKLLDRIEDLADEFRDLAEAIKEAAEAAEQAGSGGGGGEAPPPGPGLQRGGSFTVPAGVGPGGVPIRVHRLERVTVVPMGQGTAAAGNEYNFNLNVSTRDTAAGVIQEFFIARALLGA